LDGPCKDLRALCFSTDGEHLAAAGRNAQVQIWNLATSQLVYELPAGVERIRAIAYSPDGSKIVAVGHGRVATVWNAHTGEKVSEFSCRSAKVHSLVFCGNDLIATGGTDNTIRVWDLNSRTERFALTGHAGTVSALACGLTTGVIVSGSYDTTVRVWTFDAGGSPERIAQPPGQDGRLR
jgi:WD40 repeat protein